VASAARGAILIRVRALILLPLAVVMTAAEPSIQVVDHVRLAVSGGNREVECLVFYPDALAPTALVVFSHDLGRSRGAYWYLGEAWARTGLVAVFPTHASSDRAMIKQVGMLSVLDALRTAARDPQVWEERAADLAAVVAAGPALEAQVPALKGRLQGVSVGVAGHAFGALSAAVAAGLRPAPAAASPIPGVRGCILLGPPGPCDLASAEAWAGLTVPALTAVAGKDTELAAVCGVAGGSEWLAAAAALGGPGSWSVRLPTAHHFTFSNGGWGPRVDPVQVQAIAQVSSAFWRCVLLGDPNADPATLPAPASEHEVSTR
jgi:hypothetical protein